LYLSIIVIGIKKEEEVEKKEKIKMIKRRRRIMEKCLPNRHTLLSKSLPLLPF
jgi:hypothetical protein